MKYHNGLQNYKYASENWPDEEKIVVTELYVKTETDFTRIDRQADDQSNASRNTCKRVTFWRQNIVLLINPCYLITTIWLPHELCFKIVSRPAA